MNLKDAMDKFLNEPSHKNEKELIDELKRAEFLAPVIMAAPLAKPNGSAFYEEEGSNIKFAILKDDEANKSYYPAFTTRDEMMRWRKDSEQEVVMLRLKDYANMLLDSETKYDGVVIDAFSHSLVLDLNFLKAVFNE